MKLEIIDWLIILLYLAISLAIGLRFKNRAGKNLSEFFLGGRNFPWYIAGISMVATTFAADTPLAVNELVAKNGISGNWLWWNMLLGGMLTTFFFARLWRRAEILTEVELIEFRYGGKAAAFLRGFKAIYLGVFMNTLIMGWVNVALMSILQVFFGIDKTTSIVFVGLCMLLTAGYSSLSGLWGVAITDAIQFIIAMTGCIVLAILVVNSDKIGGIEGLKTKIPSWSLDFFPQISNKKGNGIASSLVITVGAFLAYISIWATSWYPGAEPGGGGYVAQRMMSAKNEKQSLYATLFFQIAHYCLRPWPWIIVGLCSIVLYPELGIDDKKLGYVMAMRDFLPTGLRGLLLVAFLAAYMSTISSQLNWGTSYLVNDLYKRFIHKSTNTEADDKHYVKASRLLTLFSMSVSLIVTTQIESISAVWSFIIECGAGLGLVLILRWYWWRINAWAEITATMAPFVAYALSKFILNMEFPDSFFFTVSFTTVSWIVVMFMTRPEDITVLKKFYEKVRPGGWWKPVEKISGILADKREYPWLFLCWFSSVLLTYSVLFFTGKIIFHQYQDSVVWLISGIIGLFLLSIGMKKINLSGE